MCINWAVKAFFYFERQPLLLFAFKILDDKFSEFNGIFLNSQLLSYDDLAAAAAEAAQMHRIKLPNNFIRIFFLWVIWIAHRSYDPIPPFSVISDYPTKHLLHLFLFILPVTFEYFPLNYIGLGHIEFSFDDLRSIISSLVLSFRLKIALAYQLYLL